MAEAQGFEPWKVLPLPVFKTGAFNRSATLPCVMNHSLRMMTGAFPVRYPVTYLIWHMPVQHELHKVGIFIDIGRQRHEKVARGF